MYYLALYRARPPCLPLLATTTSGRPAWQWRSRLWEPGCSSMVAVTFPLAVSTTCTAGCPKLGGG